jgi:hypothetical protein
VTPRLRLALVALATTAFCLACGPDGDGDQSEASDDSSNLTSTTERATTTSIVDAEPSCTSLTEEEASEVLGSEVVMAEQPIDSLAVGEPLEGLAIEPPIAVARCSWAEPGSTAPEDARLIMEVYPGGADSLTYFINRDVQAGCRVQGTTDPLGDSSFSVNCGRPGLTVQSGQSVLRLGGVQGDEEELLASLVVAALDQ